MKKLLFITLVFAAISAAAQNTVDSIPDWVNHPPKSSKMFYGVGIASSRSRDIAEKKAILAANLQLAEQAEPVKVKKLKANSKTKDGRIIEETIIREIVNVTLTEVNLIKKFVAQKDDVFTAYVMVEMKKKR